MPSPVRVGAVAYLNSKPLIYRLGELAPQAELVLDVPSRLADALAAGRLDVALVPVFECFAHPEYAVVPGVCIASEGPVYSVKLFSHTAVGDIQSVALDEGSRTSAALVRILLAERHGVRPRWEKLPLDAAPQQAQTDAILLIGDRAIHPMLPPLQRGGDRGVEGREGQREAAQPMESTGSPLEGAVSKQSLGTSGESGEQPAVEGWQVVWDLGEEWTAWTGLPFVFAVWAAQPGSDLRGLAAALRAVRDLGLSRVDEIAAAEGPPLGLTPEECRRYLTVNLHYHLGAREQQGLDLFREKAEALKLVRTTGPPRFYAAAGADQEGVAGQGQGSGSEGRWFDQEIRTGPGITLLPSRRDGRGGGP